MGKSPFMGICAYVLLKNGTDKSLSVYNQSNEGLILGT